MRLWLVALVALASCGLTASARDSQNRHESALETHQGGLGKSPGQGRGAAGGRSGAQLRQIHRRTECTSGGLPPILKSMGLGDMCADMDVAGCGEAVSFGLRFAAQRPGGTYLFQQTLDMSSDEVCGTPGNFTGTAVQLICGSQAKLCLTFMRDGVNTLKVGPDFTSGCPSIKLEGCRLLTGQLPDIVLPLDCFDEGSECSQYSSCDKCIEAGCGWCSAGYASDHACMPGDKYKPVCDVCGQGGDCDWNFGSCPIPQDQLVRQERLLNQTRDELAKVSVAMSNLERDVRNGKASLEGANYECAPEGTAASAAAAASALTAFMSFLMLFIGCGSGFFLNKRGFMDRVPSFLSRVRDQPILSSKQDSGGDAYIPPNL